MKTVNLSDEDYERLKMALDIARSYTRAEYTEHKHCDDSCWHHYHYDQDMRSVERVCALFEVGETD